MLLTKYSLLERRVIIPLGQGTLHPLTILHLKQNQRAPLASCLTHSGVELIVTCAKEAERLKAISYRKGL